MERINMKPLSLNFLIVFVVILALLPYTNSQSFAQTQPPKANGKVALPDGVAAKEVRFYSEGIQCYGRLFTPKGFSAASKAPAVVLAPGWGETAATVEKFAAHFAASGLVAMVLDYRGWGKSGGFVQTVEQVKTDDRLRFSQMTAKVRIRRKRLLPQQQILDIRNALYYLQGEAGVDRARVGVWGTDMAGGHALVIAATDARVKAVVAQVPIIEGKGVSKKAAAHTGDLHQAEMKIARTGQASTAVATTKKPEDVESRLAVAEYHPFWYVEQIPQTVAVLLVTAEKDGKVNNETNALAASKLIKGQTEMVTVPGATHAQIYSGVAFDKAAKAAAEWFVKHL
jgi:uncharacterized protein